MKTSTQHSNPSILQRVSLIAVAFLLAFVPGRALAGRPLGVDVSSYQGSSINWSSVLSSGRTFAWAKATGGTGIIDGDFTRNENNGKNAGVFMGAYHFAYPYLNTPGGEAAYFWKEADGYIKDDGKSLQPMLDMEEFKGLDGAGSYTAWANDWCADIVADCNAKGVTVTPMIYVSACNAGYFGSSITGLPWIADYNSENSQTGTPWSVCSGDDVWGTWNVWQFSSSGSVSGIPGSVDQDVFNGTATQLKASLVIGKSSVFGDYDGDGITDRATWDPATGYWYIQGTKGVSWSTHYGTTGDIPVPGDYDGDGKTDLAVFRPSNCTWYISGSAGFSWQVQFGAPGDIPVTGDFDGDGKADPAIFKPSTGTWWIDGSSKGVFTKVWGTAGDICVPADYDGDGITDPAVWRPSNGTWYIMGSMGTSWQTQYGTAGDIPVPGDYDGDGLADLCVFRGSDSLWYMNCSTAGTFTKAEGYSTDIQQCGDYDGDGISDPAVYNPFDGYYWIILGTSRGAFDTQWGAAGFRPVNLPWAIYSVYFLNATITTQPANRIVNQGQNATFSVGVSGSSPIHYQWRFNAANITGATASSYTVVNAQSTNAGSYTVVVTNVPSYMFGGAVTSSVATLTVNSTSVPPSITTQPVSLTVNQGENATYSVDATGSAPLSYQWTFDAANISGATTNSYTVTNAQSTNAGSYAVVVTNSAGTVTSSAATLTFNIPPDITTQPANLEITNGYNAPFSVVATGTAPLSFQWSFNGTNISGATASSYTVTNAQPTNSGNYSVTVTNIAGALDSTNAALEVDVPVSISSEPTNETVDLGTNAVFSVVPAGTSPFYYQWTFDGANISSATNDSYTVTNPQDNNQGSYAVVITNAAGTVTSTVATLTIAVPPAITTQPANQTVNQGQNAPFSVVATGTAPLSYQWTFNGGNISSATASSYTVANAQTSNVGSYGVVITNMAGAVTSSVATLTVDVPPSITTQPSGQTVNQGQNATFSVVASGTAPLSYQWTFNGGNLSGATTTSYTVINAQAGNAGNYAVIVTNMAGTVTSSAAVLGVNIPPAITTQPANQTVNQGQNAPFSVVASGTAPLYYQWTFNGANISSATASSYTVTNAQTSNVGSYAVVVTNMVGTVTSSSVTLAVNVSPAITTQPSSQTVNQGQNAPFSVVATGTATLYYQWKFNAANISSATTTSYTVTNAQASNAGSYTVVVTNMAGTVTSSAAVLGVNIPPSITTQPANKTVNQSSNATFSVVAAGTAPLYYQWTLNGFNITGATAASYTVVNSHSPNVGSYAVVVTNMAGTVTSSTALLYLNYETASMMDIFAQGSPTGSSFQHENWASDGAAGYGPWEPSADAGTGKPACDSYVAGILDVYERGTNNALWHKAYTAGGGWQTWASLGGTMYSDPTCTSWRTNGGTSYSFVFYQGTNTQIVERYFNTSTGWESGEIYLAGKTPIIAGGAPAASSYAYEYLNLFVRGTNNSLWTTYYTPSGWSGVWTTMGTAGVMTSDPCATSWGFQNQTVFAQTSNGSNSIKYLQFTSSGWNTTWYSIGNVGTATSSAPCASSYQSGQYNVFVRDTNNVIRSKYYVSGAWATTWGTPTGGTIGSDPCCVSWNTGN